jgi:hypothetical protein
MKQPAASILSRETRIALRTRLGRKSEEVSLIFLRGILDQVLTHPIELWMR